MTATSKSALSIGYGSGNPNGFPDFKPLNPHGRPMPKPSRPILHPEREGKPANMKLYQIWADDAHFGKRVPLSVKAPKDFLEPSMYALNKLIIEGLERRWTNPSLDPAEPMLVA